MAVAEALRSYPVRTFLDWLDREMIGIGGARERGCSLVDAKLWPGGLVPEAQAMTWANCFGLALDAIWGDGSAGDTDRVSGTKSVDASALTASPQPALAVVPQFVPPAPCPKCGRTDFKNFAGRNGHVVTCKGPKPKAAPKVEVPVALMACPVDDCIGKYALRTGIRNHIRNAHHRDPDDFLGVPPYRAAAQKVSVPGEVDRVVAIKEEIDRRRPKPKARPVFDQGEPVTFPELGQLPQYEPTDPIEAVIADLGERISALEAEVAVINARRFELDNQHARLLAAWRALKALDERTDP